MKNVRRKEEEKRFEKMNKRSSDTRILILKSTSMLVSVTGVFLLGPITSVIC